MKTFEIRRAGFTNKGATMMLIATTREIRRRLPGSRIVVAANYSVPFEPRARLGLWHRAEQKHAGLDFGRLVEFVPGKLRERYGFVTEREIDVVLDAAGFAYSDQWGLPASRDLAERSAAWKAAGKQLILLPQAFGPFEKPEIRAAIRKAADNAALIFAREKQSYEYLVDAVGARETIRLAPDFTNMLEPVRGGEATVAEEGAVAIVPNARMLDKAAGEESGRYEDFLVAAVDILRSNGLKPFFLIHETLEDLAIARKINAALAQPLRVVEADDPLVAKGLIAQCAAMVGSRFHALVSALSQAVPVIGTGWSHKYQELFRDYDYPEGLVAADLDRPAIETALAPLLSEEARARNSRRLRAASDRLKSEVSTMWDDVFGAIRA